MSPGILNMLGRLPISRKILCGFLFVCLVLTAVSGFVHYRHSRSVVMESIRDQALAQCEHFRHRFEMHLAAPVEHDLDLLTHSPQLDNYLMASQQEAIVNRAEVEKLFLSLSRGRDIYASITFLDASGHERMGTAGSRRKRPLRPLAEIAKDGPVGLQMSRLFEQMQSDPAESLSYSAPFRDAQGRPGILAAMKKQDPESGGFAGAVIQHCDLSGFLGEASAGRVLGTAVTWIYASDGENLLSPPAGQVRQDPRRYLTGEMPPADLYVRTAECRLFGREKPLMTVVCSIPREIVSRQLVPVLWSVIVIFSVLLAGSLASSFLISRWISEPIRKLTKAVRNVNGQSLDLHLDAGLMESQDEMGVLAQAFSKTIQDLKASTTSIDHLNREIAQRKHAESRLAYLASFPERSPNPVMEVGLDGAIRYANPTALDLFPDLCEQDESHPWLADWETVARKFREGQTGMDVRDVTIGGRSYQQVLHYFPDDRFVRVHGSDMTERKKAEEALQKSEEEYRSLFENMLNGFACCEMLFEDGRPQDFTYVKVNEAFGRLTGLRDVVGKRVTEVIPGIKESNPELFEIYGRVAATGKPEWFETYLDSIGWLSIAVHNPAKGYVVAIFENVTERKVAEQKQARLVKQLGEINRELTDFAYIVSHDLKAPLRAIRNVVDWLTADYADKLDEQGREYLTLLTRRATRMHNLIDGILQYSRIGRTEEKAVRVDLGKVVPEIGESLGAPEHILIEVETGLPTVQADATRISQVFQNLLSNAIKYMDKPQGHIAVGCVENDDSWTFSVSDNGPGIERRHIEHIFKLFQTLAPRDDCESTGVGLTVTKKIVEMYGGRIWVESEVGRGSTFLFTLPKHNERMTYEEHQACAIG